MAGFKKRAAFDRTSPTKNGGFIGFDWVYWWFNGGLTNQNGDLTIKKGKASSWKGGSWGIPSRHHSCFNTKLWSNDLDDLGVTRWISNLHMGFISIQSVLYDIPMIFPMISNPIFHTYPRDISLTMITISRDVQRTWYGMYHQWIWHSTNQYMDMYWEYKSGKIISSTT